MSFGLRTWAANGSLQLDTDSFTYQVIHNQVYKLTVGAVINIPISGFSLSNCTAVVVPTLPPTAQNDQNAMPFEEISEGLVTIRSRHPQEPDATVGSAIQFRLIAMRFK